LTWEAKKEAIFEMPVRTRIDAERARARARRPKTTEDDRDARRRDDDASEDE